VVGSSLLIGGARNLPQYCKLVTRDPKASDYLREVYFVAKRYFPDNLKYWLEGARSFTYHASERAPYDWMDVYDARKKLKGHGRV
jgi:hypothetical protein